MKKNFFTIILIVLFSILLWVFVSFSGDFAITLNLPVSITGLPEKSSISSISASNVSISVKGKGWQLAQHTIGRQPKFFISKPLVRGNNNLSVRNAITANNWISTNLQITEVVPEKINVGVEKTEIKKVEIAPLLVLEYKPGYNLVSEIKLNPDSIEIIGPASLIKEINTINTNLLKLSKLDESKEVKLKLNKLNFIKYETNETTISFDVQKIVDKSFENLKIETKNIPPRYELKVSPANVTVVLRGGINNLSKYKEKDIKVTVDFAEALNDTSGAIEPTVTIPEFVTLIDLKPNRLEYIIKKY
ncbi:MAG: hypothetical protein CR986_04610 [Ignavibacteriae bacterium]|nr:MAG: hypothetical protein CR986_04610 [Ignavibacteriota bacterium]